jgi:RNA polymerase sigma factor (sigma-70 family)
MILEKKSGFSCQAEVTLYQQAQAGCSESLNELMKRHEGLVHWVVQRQWLLSLPYEDALQAGRQGLWRAILGYDPGRGTTIGTYAYQAIMKHVWAAVKGEQRRLGKEIPLGVLVVCCYQEGPDPARLGEWEEVSQSVLGLVGRLPAGQAEVIRRRYGLEGGMAQTQAEIAKQFGVSQQWISQLESAALVWLRQPAHSQALRSLLRRHNQAQYELADRQAQVWLRQRGGRHERV